MKNKPSKFFAPIVIAGVTIGFLASAYKFVFSKPELDRQAKVKSDDALESTAENTQQSEQHNLKESEK